MTLAVVITTIQAPTKGVRQIATRIRSDDELLILVGDRKTPNDFSCPNATYLSVESQLLSPFRVAQEIPENSYARKMVGYLHAAQEGVDWIRETDDDNEPYDVFFEPVPESLECRIPAARKWINPYAYFAEDHLWPRGFPLDEIADSFSQLGTTSAPTRGDFVLQGLADGDPDVDAIFRLVSVPGDQVSFRNDKPLLIPASSWVPFNSQVTTWPRSLFFLLYLPVTCSFRMTDIWRSYVAQRLMHDLDVPLVYTGPMVFQDRNEHDLMKDFRDEIEGYTNYSRVVDALQHTKTSKGADVASDLVHLYEALVQVDAVTPAELRVLDAWITDSKSLGLVP